MKYTGTALVAILAEPERWPETPGPLHTHGAFGPTCLWTENPGRSHHPECDHGSCLDQMYGGTECPECYTRFMDSAEPEVIRCGLHGDVTVTDSGSNSGFAGEGVWWWTLSCGCHHMEEGVYTDM